MKPRVLITLSLVVMIPGFILWRVFRAPEPGATIAPKVSQTANRSSHFSTVQPAERRSGGVPIPGAAERARLEALTKEQHESFRAAFTTPRNLYGMVVDDVDHPVEGASIYVSAADKTSTEPGSKYHLNSDKNGRFSLEQTPGASFYIEVSKAGYYAYSASSGSVAYALPDDPLSRPPPSLEYPAKFYLHKSNPAQLIYHKCFQRVAKAGTPCEISFTTGRQATFEQGDLRVEAWTLEGAVPGGPAEWKCRIAAPGGGLIERRSELSFEAPETGYVLSFEFDRKSEGESAVPGSKRKKFFVKTRNEKYARIEFEMIADGDHFFALWSYLNPSGSRNLEPDTGAQASGR